MIKLLKDIQKSEVALFGGKATNLGFLIQHGFNVPVGFCISTQVTELTDEGGILCHAAIVSREMHKPCIVGTGEGTHKFKDNDTVEVNANNGVIKKI